MLPIINDTIEKTVWGDRLQGGGRGGRILATLLRYLYGLVRDIIYGQLTLRSMSLVYTTLLSIVPLIAFSFSVLKGFGVHEQLEPFLYDFLTPLGAQGQQIGNEIMALVKNVNSGLLGGISLAFFIYTAISMVQKVEESFNYVWYVSEPRSFARRFTEYTIILLIGPVAVFAVLGIIASIQSDNLMQWLLSSKAFSPIVYMFAKLTPYLVITAIFTFLYKYLPNTPVNFTAALVGGFVGGFMWVTMGAFFTSFVVESESSRIPVVYRSFAVAVLALFWLYLNWLILLIGAQIAFYFQKPAYLRIGRREPRLSNSVRERLALNIMYLVGKTFREPGTDIKLSDISSKLKIPTLALAPVIGKLERAGLLLTTEHEALIPGRDLALTSLHDILDVVRSGGETGSYRDPCWDAQVDDLAGRLDAAIADTLSDATLAQFVEAGQEKD
ncbi:MAG: YihY family inner membrane protein [Woeseia sp.]|nr:YihY/virulence factor BrkB family protein [Woeseia sp.]NNL54446.1 YihY family inner membrane protein [Woeseia sp.]